MCLCVSVNIYKYIRRDLDSRIDPYLPLLLLGFRSFGGVSFPVMLFSTFLLLFQLIKILTFSTFSSPLYSPPLFYPNSFLKTHYAE